MGNIKGTLSKWYKGLALDQQRVYQRELEKQMLQNPVQGLTTAVELQHQMQQQAQAQERELAAQEQTAQIKLGALKRILSSLVFQLRILDLDAIEDKKTSTVPLRVPVKVIKELLEELDSKDPNPVYPEWPGDSTVVDTAAQYPYNNAYVNYSGSNNQLSGTTKKGV